MANEIDLVVGSAVTAQIATLMTELTEVDKKIQDIGKSAVAMNTALGVKDTASLTKLTAENEKLNKKIQELTGSSAVLETKLANLAAAQSKATKAATDASIAEEKLLAATNKNTTATEKKTKAITEDTIAQREANKQATINATINNEQVGAYKRLEAQYQKTAQKALDLGAANKQNTEEYKRLVKESQELGQRLKSIDSDVGKHTRNVGNYASSWNGLGNSINQLTREAPAFANSVQTGFMALSNNIPILTDELGVLIAKNKALQADGKPTQSILKTVAGAFFSWQTAISLGVTILTVYGAKLVDMAMGLGNVQKALKSLEQAQKDSDNRISDTTRNIEAQTAIAIANAKMRGASQKELDDLTLTGQKNKLLNLQKERDLLVADAALVEQYNAKRGKNIVNQYTKELEDTKKYLKENFTLGNTWSGYKEKEATAFVNRRNELQAKSDKENNRIQGISQGEGARKLKDNLILRENEVKIHGQKLNVLTKELQASQFEANNKANKQDDKLAEDAAKAEKERKENEFKGDIADLENKKDIAKDRLDLFKGEVKDKIALSMNLANKEIDLAEKVYEYNLFLAGEDAGLRKKALAERSKAVRDSFKENVERAGDFYSDFFKKADESLPKTLFGDKYKMTNEQKADLKAHEDYIKKTLDEIKNYLGSFSSELGSNLGFKETFDFFIKVDEKGKNMWQKLDEDGVSSKEKFATRFNAITESAQEAFNFISNLSQENIKDEYNRLDKQKEISLGFAGDSAAAKEKIEEDYNKKKNEIAKKEAKAKKEQAIMNIAIDTAQAIMGLWVKPGFPAAIPMAIAVGALGALQIGMVASQKIPQYAKGTDNHKGGLMLVNDGAGNNFQEKVILPSGKVIRPQGRNVLMDAPKGTKVLNHEQQLFEMLQNNNISMSSQQASGLTYDEMNEIFQKNLSNIKTQNTIFDKNGFQSYVKNGNSITRSNSNRSQAIGISV